MLSAVLEDFQKAGHDVVLPVDGRVWDFFPNRTGLEKRKVLRSDDLGSLLLDLTREVDFVLIVAPETESILVECLKWLSPVQQKLLNPDVAFTSLTSNKNKMFEYLRAMEFEDKLIPFGNNYEEYLEEISCFGVWRLPLVLKPADGAGGDEVNFIFDWSEAKLKMSRAVSEYRIEEFVSGTPVSVSAICGPSGCDLLTPTIQVFEDNDPEPGFHYVKAKYPMADSLSDRAIHLATKVIAALPPARGYIGIDMILGDEKDGEARDVLIEINPRLTTSYLKLRELYANNLANRMIEKVTDKPLSQSDDGQTTSCSLLKPSL